jgi:hypothetical protein
MDRFTLVCLASIFVFFVLGVILNYPRKNKTGTKNDSVNHESNENDEKERSKNRFNGAVR